MMCFIFWTSSVSQWLDNCGQRIKRLSGCEYSQMTVCFFNSENTTLADIMLCPQFLMQWHQLRLIMITVIHCCEQLLQISRVLTLEQWTSPHAAHNNSKVLVNKNYQSCILIRKVITKIFLRNDNFHIL